MKNLLLVHIIKAIEYRFINSIAGSKEDFGLFKVNNHTRSPNEIINHMFDLATKTNMMIKEGHFNVPPPQILDFIGEKERFLIELNILEMLIGSFEIDLDVSRKLLQGPILDMVTHIGQLAMLNGMHGNKIPKESYYNAAIK